jgi:hypothetical protein
VADRAQAAAITERVNKMIIELSGAISTEDCQGASNSTLQWVIAQPQSRREVSGVPNFARFSP